MSRLNRQQATQLFREQIRAANTLHTAYLDDEAFSDDYERFATWQFRHLLPFFHDLAAQQGYAEAIEFTMTDLAGVGISHRDRDLERAAPAITRMLPLRALISLAEAAEANARVLKINIAICKALSIDAKLPDTITEVDYCIACRKASSLDELVDLVRKVCGLGRSLKSLVKIPAIGMTLRAMRGPARAAGFAALHDFLETGYLTFKDIPDIDHFLDVIERRMIDVFTLIYTVPLDEVRKQALRSDHFAAMGNV